MIVLVTGGRDYKQQLFVDTILDDLDERFSHGIRRIVTGACRDKKGNAIGADHCAERWARKRERRYEGFPAPFTSLGRSGGMIRNTEMFQETDPDVVVAFPGGRGTTGMLNLSLTAINTRCKLILVVDAMRGTKADTIEYKR